MLRKNFTLIEIIILLVAFLVLLGLVLPATAGIHKHHIGSRDLNNSRNIVTLMLMYADDDIDKQLMPFPPSAYDNNGKPIRWGSNGNRSVDIAHFLLSAQVVENASIFKSRTSNKKISFYTIENDDPRKKRWEDNSALYYQIYSNPNLKSSDPASTIMVANIDGNVLSKCTSSGKGWSVSFLDGSGKWFKRHSYDYHKNKGEKISGPANDIASDGKLMSLKPNIYRGGGSSAFMGKIKSDPIFKWMTQGLK